MSKHYKCLDCIHLTPRYDLLECNLQTVRFLRPDQNSWTFDPACIHDTEVASRKYNNPEYSPVLTDKFKQK